MEINLKSSPAMQDYSEKWHGARLTTCPGVAPLEVLVSERPGSRKLVNTYLINTFIRYDCAIH